ncbi:hypothetical protein [uncultured Pontibacter sp.]|uniref:hypothetical protein n=1 Tax=uncultured Pontibacter sp. TaxID=453356 RepID=UPI002624942F|nr:hypothetical protein [uncultured Pontibacter sp.]
MEEFNWKQEGFSGRNYVVNAAAGHAGKLVFDGWSSYNAVYSLGENKLMFSSKGWFEQEVTIHYNGEVIGHGTTSTFGKTRIDMVSGERYVIQSKSFSQEQAMTDGTGQRIVTFKQPGFSFGKGQIAVADGVSELTKVVLVGTGLYFKALTDSQTTILIAVFIPVFLQIMR